MTRICRKTKCVTYASNCRRDTPYDANFQVKKSDKEKKVDVDAKIRHAQTKGIIMNILGLLALIDIIRDWWGPSK